MTNTNWTPITVESSDYQGRYIPDTYILDDTVCTMDGTLAQINGLKLQTIFAPDTTFYGATTNSTTWTQA